VDRGYRAGDHLLRQPCGLPHVPQISTGRGLFESTRGPQGHCTVWIAERHLLRAVRSVDNAGGLQTLPGTGENLRQRPRGGHRGGEAWRAHQHRLADQSAVDCSAALRAGEGVPLCFGQGELRGRADCHDCAGPECVSAPGKPPHQEHVPDGLHRALAPDELTQRGQVQREERPAPGYQPQGEHGRHARVLSGPALGLHVGSFNSVRRVLVSSLSGQSKTASVHQLTTGES